MLNGMLLDMPPTIINLLSLFGPISLVERSPIYLSEAKVKNIKYELEQVGN
jgi:hypothetical protein